jgi:hypothetical protein
VEQSGVSVSLEFIERETHIIMETAIPAPEISFFKVQTALDLTSE